MRVLIMADHYLPGYLAGGPIRSLSAIVDALGTSFDFRIVTRDRDLGSNTPHSGILLDEWQRTSHGHVRYLSPGNVSALSLRSVIVEAEPDLIYLNSFFSKTFSISMLALRRVRAIPQIPVLLAPRGELSMGALTLKPVKKRSYLAAGRALGLYRDLTWHVSSPFEEAEIYNLFGQTSNVRIAPNLTPSTLNKSPRVAKRPGSLRVAFLSRLSRKKNLLFALDAFQGVHGQIEFNVYGPPEDVVYRSECESRARGLASNIRVRFHGAVPHDQISLVLGQNELFLLPTLGENFGHVIFEALSAGCPILVSDRTPWRELEKAGVGWDVSLSEHGRFNAILQRCVNMGEIEHRTLSEGAVRFASHRGSDPRILEQNRAMFLDAAAHHSSHITR